MKYRIKIVRYKNGRVEYFAQVKKMFGWVGLSFEGKVISCPAECDSRERALNRIDLHFSGNTKVQKIEFEYISKN